MRNGTKIFSALKSLNINALTPSKKALSFTLGFYLSLFPLFGVTTILNLIASFVFKLNVVLTQALNLVLMPIQLLMMYPFFLLGRILFFPENEPIISLSFSQLMEANRTETFYLLLETLAGGIMVWALASLFTGFFVYQLLLKINFRRLKVGTVRVRR